ncbi:GLPGLI family protein [Sphingobacterium nematocida]|uniref:GLPGLI family protein n=1 Tax=Sphingobacterium nematocida TaxID=1513896 RepID=A0A1T5FI15_9SPHI|nr:GLPGLI family protein [Sphingobacterium nematocida]SKB95757.1 GLPGLI family protein [Sphingobacterium nematocida]
MRRILIFSFMALGATLSMAQEKPLAKVHYIFKHVNDTTQRDKHVRDEVVTYLGEKGTYYTSYSMTRMQDDVKKQIDDPAFDGNLTILQRTSPVSEAYIIEPAQLKITEIAKVASDEFVLSGTYPQQDWEILDESKEIGGYSCQKATTDFKGRHYIVWFTTDIPFPGGPWKLHGLPGLILSAKDSKGEVEFEYAGFDKLEAETTIRIAPSAKAIPSTAAEVEKLEKAFRENPSAYLNSRSNVTIGSSGSMVVRSGSGSSSSSTLDTSKIKSMNIKKDDSYKPSKTTNNPIELTP